MSTAPRLLRFPQGGLATILRFCAKSEGNETTQTSSSWPGSWKSSGLLLELSTVLLLVQGPLLRKHSMLLLGPAVDDSLCGALYTSIIPVKLPDIPELCFMLLQADYSRNYAGILYASLTPSQLWRTFHSWKLGQILQQWTHLHKYRIIQDPRIVAPKPVTDRVLEHPGHNVWTFHLGTHSLPSRTFP